MDNIPFSLALRIIHICTDPVERDENLTELRNMLLSWDYKQNPINHCIEKALAVPHTEALKLVIRNKTSERTVLPLQYDPRLPSAVNIFGKHYRTMVNTDPHLKEVFPSPPLIAY